MASGSDECQFPGCDSMTPGNGLSLALFSWGVAFDMKRRRRDAALTSHGISPAVRRAARTRRPVAAAPAAATAGLLHTADNPHICSGKPLVVAMEADGLIQVFDVWESEAKFQAFGKTLLPIMKGLEADPGEPQATAVHNIIKG